MTTHLIERTAVLSLSVLEADYVAAATKAPEYGYRKSKVETLFWRCQNCILAIRTNGHTAPE